MQTEVLSRLWGSIALAQTAGNVADSAAQSDFIGAFVRMVAVLACVIGLLLVVAAALKKFSLLQRPLLGARRSIRILETAYLGPKQSLALVQAGRDVLLIGLTQQTITLLTKIDRANVSSDTESDVLPDHFSSVLDHALRAEPESHLRCEQAAPQQKNWLARALGRFSVHRIGE